MNIAIVNDTPFAVEMLRRVLSTRSPHTIGWIARNGASAAELCRHETPDLVLMDISMPLVDGVEATRRIMRDSPCPILIVSAADADRDERVFAALGAGALDVTGLPSMIEASGPATPRLIAAIDRIERRLLLTPDPASGASGLVTPTARHPAARTLHRWPVIAIGSSAGGPEALRRLLSRLPADLPATIIVAQHIDSQFVESMRDWMDAQIPMPVLLAEQDQALQSGRVYILRTERHGAYTERGAIAYEDIENAHFRPSIDRLFESLAGTVQPPALGVVLSGMGRDGASGLRSMRDAGCLTLAQNQASSAVYGMPKAAFESGAAGRSLSLEDLADVIEEHVTHHDQLKPHSVHPCAE